MNELTNQDRSLQLMKMQLRDMEANPRKYMNLMASGYVCAGFGGDLNGIQVPPTLMQGRIPPGTTPQQAFEQVLAFMRQVISEAEQQQGRIAANGQVLGIRYKNS